MGEIRENVKNNLKYYLELRGISQKELAIRLSISQSAVTNWITGKNSPDIDMVAEICKVLNISIVDLFGCNKTNEYTEIEKKIIIQYRNKPELKKAIHILLEIQE